MFNDAVVVQSAVSAFNNAALIAPAFLWWALLSVPLFAMVYFCGNSFLVKIGWDNKSKMTERFALTTVILTLAWVVLFGGNYNVLRDSMSVLPMMIAAISFLCALFIGSYSKNITLSGWKNLTHRQKWGTVIGGGFIFAAIGLSDMHAWWGPLLQVGSVLAGVIIGRAAGHKMRPVAGTVLIMMAVITAILMQPEYFRFGQLGSLTFVHLLALVFMGVFAVVTIVIRNVNPRGKIHHSAYVKLKWLARFMAALSVVLFIMTESVPVFLGMLGVFAVSCAMSVWHSASVPERLDNLMFAAALMMFGVITTMPVITALGILYWGNNSISGAWAKSKFLL